MASKKRLPSITNNSNTGGGILAKVTDSTIYQKGKQTASDATFVTKKLLKSTGKAAWIFGVSFLVIALPLIIELERDTQLEAMELQQASLLGTPTPNSKPY